MYSSEIDLMRRECRTDLLLGILCEAREGGGWEFGFDEVGGGDSGEGGYCMGKWVVQVEFVVSGR